jgi:hypothetical protein
MNTSTRNFLIATLCLNLLLTACGRRLRNNTDPATAAPALTSPSQVPAASLPPAAQPTQAAAASQPTATLVVQPTQPAAATEPAATQSPAATATSAPAADQPDPQADELDKLFGQLDSQLKGDGQSIEQVNIP